MREEQGVELHHVYRSEREDWIQTMVMAGIGIAFLPEYSVILPGLQTRPLVEPEVVREVALVTVAGRRFSPAVATFVRAIWRGSSGLGPQRQALGRSVAVSGAITANR